MKRHGLAVTKAVMEDEGAKADSIWPGGMDVDPVPGHFQTKQKPNERKKRMFMKKFIITTLAVAAMSLASVTSAWAADKTIEGVASCAEGHETVIKVKDGEKTVTYHLAKNEESREFHGKVCGKPAPVKATGEAKEVNGKMVFMAKKIELAKK